MKKFSWHSEQGLAPHWYKIYGWLPNRYLPLVMFDSICIYKPNMKGGHTHNHFYNVCSRHLRRSKDRRKQLFKELLDKKTCIYVFNNGVQNPKCRESFVRVIFK